MVVFRCYLNSDHVVFSCEAEPDFIIDQQITHKIEEKFPSNQETVTILVSKRHSLCKIEEDLSEEIWKKKEDWYKK